MNQAKRTRRAKHKRRMNELLRQVNKIRKKKGKPTITTWRPEDLPKESRKKKKEPKP